MAFHRDVTRLTLFLFLAFPAAWSAANPVARPNIIVILADDLGGRELGCYGNTFNETPRLDAMAAEGMRFMRAYSAGPVCSPTRASLLTGQNPARHGITDFLQDRDDAFLDPARFTALPRILKSAGYRTGLIGKWHLRGNYSEDKGTPAQHGFDEAILTETSYIGLGDYRFPYRHIAGAVQRIHPEEDLTRRLNLEAVDFIERNRASPFFLYLSHYAVHTTLDAPDSLTARFTEKRGQASGPADRNPALAAMLKVIDDGVGEIGAKLKALGLDSNTLVIFTSDNGGDLAVTSNADLRKGKSTLYEGGLVVPFLARWPGKIAPGTGSEVPMTTADLLPTLAALAGATLPAGQAVDGSSLEPILRGRGSLAPRSLVWHFPQALDTLRPSSAALLDPEGRKVIRSYDTDRLEVFRPASDRSELRDLAPGDAALASSLGATLFAEVARLQAGTAYSDDFGDRDASGWKAFECGWSAAGGAYAVDSGDGCKALTHDRYFSHLDIRADVRPGRSGSAGVLLRASAARPGRFAYRGYYAYVSAASGKVALARTLNGASVDLASRSQTVSADASHQLRVVARGPEFKVYFADMANPIMTVRDSALDGGLIGFRAHGGAAAFDNLHALALPAEKPVAIARPRGAPKREGDRLVRRGGALLHVEGSGAPRNLKGEIP